MIALFWARKWICSRFSYGHISRGTEEPRLSDSSNEPCHEIMALSVLRKLILQTRMRSHPVGLDVWFLVGPFVYFTCANSEGSGETGVCAGSPEPSLVAYNCVSWLVCSSIEMPSLINIIFKIPNLRKVPLSVNYFSVVCFSLPHYI